MREFELVGGSWQNPAVSDDPRDRLAHRIVRERVRLASHLPELDPLRELDPDGESVEMHVAVDIDLAAFEATDGSERLLAIEGIRETADFMLYVVPWRRLYCLTNDGEYQLVATGMPSGARLRGRRSTTSASSSRASRSRKSPTDDGPPQ